MGVAWLEVTHQARKRTGKRSLGHVPKLEVCSVLFLSPQVYTLSKSYAGLSLFFLLQQLGGTLFSLKVSFQSRDFKCNFESPLCLSYQWNRFSRSPVGNK